MTNIRPFRPLLAATIEDDGASLEKLAYPMIASPKVDGIRVVVHPELGPITRSSKPVPNIHIRSVLKDPLLSGLDGEIVSGPICADDVFNRTTSAVMTHDGTPQFTYHIFDHLAPDAVYSDRLHYAQSLVGALPAPWGLYIKVLPARLVKNHLDVLDAEIDWLAHGYEGVMLRHWHGPYKQGRSTLKEQTLLKLKRFKDAEAVVVGFEPLFHNQNPQTRSAQGLAERSDHKAGKVQVETLGALRVQHASGFGEFAIGSGFDQSSRDEIWSNRPLYLGKTVKFKYQEIGTLEKPRFPIFLGFRGAE
jgi:DNA ligase-1